ncbi:hypothetical protein V8D89_008236 [Ganoderma adspersum]
MPTLICRICLDALHEKKMISTKCGHIFCAECAGVIFARTRVRVPCPVCRKPNTHSQLVRLFPEWELTEDAPTPHQPRRAPTPPPPSLSSDSIAAGAKPDFTSPSVAPAYYYTAPTTASSTTVELYVPLSLHPAFPWDAAGEVPAWDLDGTPVYLGITLFNGGWHPCKVKPYAACRARVSYGGKEVAHPGMCHLLPFNPAAMEWVPTSRGRIPGGRRPVEGGYEEFGGEMLYHALASVDGVKVPGKAGQHLAHGASIPYRNQEYIVGHYDIL